MRSGVISLDRLSVLATRVGVGVARRQYNYQQWRNMLTSYMSQGSGSKAGSVLFRSQQFGTDQICYPCHILTRTVAQEPEPTQIS